MTNTLRIMRALALALAAATAVLSACGGSSGGAQTAPPVSTSPASSFSVAPTPTGRNAPTPEGASAFAKFFYGQITAAFASRNPDLIRSLSAPGCKTCALYVDSVKSVVDKGQKVEGGEFAIKFAVAPQLASRDRARVDVGWDFGGAVFYGSNGQVAERHAPETGVEEQLTLQRSGDHWLVAEITRTRTRQ